MAVLARLAFVAAVCQASAHSVVRSHKRRVSIFLSRNANVSMDVNASSAVPVHVNVSSAGDMSNKTLSSVGNVSNDSAAVNLSSPLVVPDMSGHLIDDNLQLAANWMSFVIDHTKNSTWYHTPETQRYYQCGAFMNAAWKELSQNPCEEPMHKATREMKVMVPHCSSLRHGASFVKSYYTLVSDIDSMCNGPLCKPECYGGVPCMRSPIFPFDPYCPQTPTKAPKSKSLAWSAWGQPLWVLAAGLMAVCIH